MKVVGIAAKFLHTDGIQLLKDGDYNLIHRAYCYAMAEKLGEKDRDEIARTRG